VGYATITHRVLLLIAAACLIKPGLITDIIGFGIMAGVALLQWNNTKRATV
jgi:UPF0716 family protein affecting phage T7 exclusion